MVAGDTNRDGNLTSPRSGDWRGFIHRGWWCAESGSVCYLRFATRVPVTELNGLVTWPGDQVQWVHDAVTVKTGSTLIIEAGAMVKFGPYEGIILEPGASLVTEGTVAQPVIFTSEKDDRRGGDTNGDGDSTTPAAGDWRWIHVNGATATFDHTEIRYGGGTESGASSQTGAIRTSGQADVTVDNSLIADSLFDGILPLAGPCWYATASSSILNGRSSPPPARM